MIDVSAAIIKNVTGEVLICRRGAGGSCAYLWEFPGGKQEDGETPKECLVRECKEELGIEIVVGMVFARTFYQCPERGIRFTFFLAEIISGTPRLSVHLEVQWVKPKDLLNYEFCPADVEVVEKLM